MARERTRVRDRKPKRPALSELLRMCPVDDNVTVTKVIRAGRVRQKTVREANEKLALAKRTAFRVTETYGHLFEVRLGQALLSDGSQTYFIVITKKANGIAEDGTFIDTYYQHLFDVDEIDDGVGQDDPIESDQVL